MKPATRFLCGLTVGLGTMVAAPVAFAQQAPEHGPAAKGEPSALVSKQFDIMATVDKVDAAHRRLTLKMPDGSAMTTHVPLSIKGFEQLKPGDRVNIDFYESAILSWKRKGAGVGEQLIVAEGAGDMPSAVMADTIHATVKITKIDRANHKITVTLPTGETETLSVTDRAMKADLAKLNEGDQLDVRFTRAAAIAVKPPGQAKPAQPQPNPPM